MLSASGKFQGIQVRSGARLDNRQGEFATASRIGSCASITFTSYGRLNASTVWRSPRLAFQTGDTTNPVIDPVTY